MPKEMIFQLVITEGNKKGKVISDPAFLDKQKG